jgi:hypothetical protein
MRVRGCSQSRNSSPQRYWGDLNPYIAPIAIALQDLERRGVLQFWVDFHHTALHLIVLPYANLVCERAMAAWNSHYVSTRDMQCSPNRKCEPAASSFCRTTHARLNSSRSPSTPAVALSMAAQVRQDRWQEVITDADGFVQLAPQRARALEARGEAVGPYAPHESLAWIDEFSASVIRDADRVRTWRRPVSEPAAWFTHDIREAIAAAVTPLVPGAGELRVELERRFLRALTYLSTLDGRAQLGHAVTVADVTAISVILL